MKRRLVKNMLPILLSLSMLPVSVNLNVVFAQEENSAQEITDKVVKTIKTAKVSGITYELTSSATPTTPGDAYVYLNQNNQKTDVVIPAQITVSNNKYNVIGIKENAFKENLQLNTIYIGENIKHIPSNAFLDCSNLKSYEVDKNNKYFDSIDGILYNSSKTKVLSSPIGKKLETYSMPETVIEVGDYAFKANNTLYSVSLSPALKTIGNNSFEKCSSLTTISMYNNIETIGSYAFANSKLSKLKLSTDLKKIGEGAFLGTLLREVKIPTHIEKIEPYTFYNCNNLKTFSVNPSNSVISEIGDYAFAETALETVNMPITIKTLGNNVFYNCKNLIMVNLNPILSSIGNEVFANCSILNSINIPQELDEIGEDTFLGCSKLANVTVSANNKSYDTKEGVLYTRGFTELIYYPSAKLDTSFILPSNVTKIHDNAFAFCKNINSFEVEAGNYKYSSENDILYNYNKTELIQYPLAKGANNFSIPSYVNKIASYCFADSLIVGSINIPSDVIEIGEYAFYNCAKIDSININSNNKYYYSEGGVLFTYDKKVLLQYPINKKASSYSVPITVETIYEGAFANSTITDITLPERLKEINNSAFYKTKFIYITLPDSLETIGEYAFANSSLAKITIPKSVSDIKNGAFSSNNNLKTVIFENPLPLINIGNDVFENTGSLEKIIVPVNSTSYYINALSKTGISNSVLVTGDI